MNVHPGIRGELFLFVAASLFACISLCVKFASAYYSGLFVSASRFGIGTILCTVVLCSRRPPFDRGRLLDVALRGFFGALSMISTYLAIGFTGPGRATLLSNTYPLFVGVFAALFFGERLSPRIVLSLGLCSVGAVLVIRDGSGASLLGDALALLGSLSAGIAINFLRRASAAGVDPFMLYLSPCLFGLPLFVAAPAPTASGGSLGVFLLLAVGGGGFLAQTLMAKGYRTVPAGRGSVVFYWETALTVALGALFAGETLNLRFGIGLLLILAGLWTNSASLFAAGSRTR